MNWITENRPTDIFKAMVENPISLFNIQFCISVWESLFLLLLRMREVQILKYYFNLFL